MLPDGAGIAAVVLANKQLKTAQQQLVLISNLAWGADMYSEIMKHNKPHGTALEEAVGSEQGLTTSWRYSRGKWISYWL